ncbi:uncharacterized protein C8A04DRAFT_24685 [Dichotomopilus funicola]|uniref:Uncharacterized protein n=1 Tax=Dichotomopilus funicola TaxID=1934379 RepID=A0AAN6V9M7_9PEZI|nr:hypothetical protein C8A04DRAFT_24685 [Dichotomopilus funicola]
MAGHEGGHWTTELGDWIRFLRWRKRNFDRRVEDAPESSEPPLPDAHDVDAYALHLEFREHLLEIVTNPKKHAFVRDSRKRLDTLEPQLAEMRAERGLPADDNPPPPALIALWEDEAAKKAAELAALPPIDQPAFGKRPRGVPPDPPRPWKRKRERAENHSDEVAAGAPTAMGQPPSAKRRSTRAAQPAEQPTEQPAEPPTKQLPKKRVSAKAATVVAEQPAESPTRRRSSKRGAATVADPPTARPVKRRAAPAVTEVPLRRSSRIAALPRKNYKG